MVECYDDKRAAALLEYDKVMIC